MLRLDVAYERKNIGRVCGTLKSHACVFMSSCSTTDMSVHPRRIEREVKREDVNARKARLGETLPGNHNVLPVVKRE